MNETPPPERGADGSQPPQIRIDESPVSHTRRKSKSPAPLAAMAVAVLLGGLLAWGVVAMIPPSWKLRMGGKSADDAQRGAAENAPSEGDDTKDWPPESDPKIAIPARTDPQRTAASASDDATNASRAIETAAANLLARAKTLLTQKKTDEAIRLLEDVRNRYPGSRAAIEAEKLLLSTD